MGRPTSADALRERYLQFFAAKGHDILPGASLVPAGDPTLLLTSAGMVPFKPYFLGLETPKVRRVTTCQRCVRTGDIENVGLTDRHHTFFEMLGNFSFGDYFKEEAIHFAWEFVTQELELPADRLWASIYLEDDEAHEIWSRDIGLPDNRIVRLGKSENFWEIGVGPCGPCSEIYYDRGESYGCGRPECAPACDECERFLEIWNLVFIQFHQDEEGNLTPLKSTGVDTGMGLERTASVLQGVDSNFEIDNIAPIVRHIAEVARVPYGEKRESDISIRVITDHMRGVAFMIFDGILPGNEGRGYVLRRLLRRAVRHAKLLGIEGAFLPGVVDLVIDQLNSGYPDLEKSRDMIKRVVSVEESRFHETLDQGIEILESRMEELQKSDQTTLSGSAAFQLYDTYGFPVELTQEILVSRGLTLDSDGFEEAMEAQRERARAARRRMGYLGEVDVAYGDLDMKVEVTPFVGYDSTEIEAEVVGLIAYNEQVGRVEAGQDVEVFLDRTPFYPEGGGQVPDSGSITAREGQIRVKDVARVAGGLIVHRGRVASGVVQVGDRVQATIDLPARQSTARNHTATHLMHKALHEVVGDHANQAGSLVSPERLRFDFTHFKPMSPDEVQDVERRVNEKILENLPVESAVMSFDEAKAGGATALFGEKYGDEVRVVRIGEYSKELCGGTHASSSAELGLFKVVYESGVAANVRRIEAVTGRGALEYLSTRERALTRAAEQLQVTPGELPTQVEKVLGSMREQEREIAKLKGRLAQAQVGALAEQAEEVGGVKVLCRTVEGLDMDGLRALGDRLKAELGCAALVLGGVHQNKVLLVAMATDDAVARGIKANETLRRAAAVVSGGGGGNERMAQAGGKDPEALPEALKEASESFRQQLHEQAATTGT